MSARWPAAATTGMVAVRLVLGGTFLWAGVPKALAPAQFAPTVQAYRLLPPAWVTPVAVGLPWVEGVIGCCLIAGLWTRSSALVSAVLMAVFTTAVAVNLYRGVDMACGCFGGDEAESLWTVLLRDVLLLAGAVVLVRARSRPRLSVDRLLGWTGGQVR